MNRLCCLQRGEKSCAALLKAKYTQRFASSSRFCPWRRKREPFRPVAWPHRDKTHMLQLGGRKKVGQRKKQTLQEGMKSKIKESEVF